MTKASFEMLFTEGSIIDPETLAPRFFEGKGAPVTYSSAGDEGGWYVHLPVYDEWHGPFSTETQARFEIPDMLFDVEMKEIEVEYRRAGLERNGMFPRNPVYRSFSKREGEQTIVVEQDETSLTILAIPDADTTLMRYETVSVDHLRSPDFRRIGLEDGRLRTVMIDPTFHVIASVEKPSSEDYDTIGHEIAAARQAISFIESHQFAADPAAARPL